MKNLEFWKVFELLKAPECSDDAQTLRVWTTNELHRLRAFQDRMASFTQGNHDFLLDFCIEKTILPVKRKNEFLKKITPPSKNMKKSKFSKLSYFVLGPSWDILVMF